MHHRVRVLGVSVDNVRMEQAVRACEEAIADKSKPHMIATANAEMIMAAQQDLELFDILARADLVVPDGAGVVWAARYKGSPLPERVAGYDLVQNLLKVAGEKGYRVFLLGGAPGIAEQAKNKALNLYPGLVVAGVQDGYFSPQQETEVFQAIKLANPDILLVALGVPRQEKWIAKNMAELNIALSIGVGGTFDVMAGTVTRAPVWMQRSNLEWLYRLLCQPQRAIRMLALPRFVLCVVTGKKD